MHSYEILKTTNPFFQKAWDGEITFGVFSIHENNEVIRKLKVGDKIYLEECEDIKKPWRTEREMLVKIETIVFYPGADKSDELAGIAFQVDKKYIAAFGPDAPAFP